METFELLWTAGSEWKIRILVLAVIGQMALAIRLYGVMSAKRMKAGKEGRITTETYRATQAEPEDLAVFNRAVVNQFEAPVLFYALVIMALALGTASWVTVVLAITYVVLRWMHGNEMIGAHDVLRRRRIFIRSFQALIALMAEVTLSAMIWA